jgi:hypothetical protein
MTRSISIFAVFIAVVIGIAGAGVLGATPVQASPLFRIIDVRAEYGQLVVEAEHFNADDGSHWFYENYTFSGREEYQRPRVTDQAGQWPTGRLFIRSTGMVAPTRFNPNSGLSGRIEHYLPDGEEWLRHPYPKLTAESIANSIQLIHARRTLTGWSKGVQRLTTHPMNASAADMTGAPRLAQRFAGLVTAAYTATDSGTLTAYNGPLPAIDPYVSSAWGTVSTFFPDSSPESTSVDGWAGATGSGTWAALRAASGSSSGDSDGEIYVPRLRTNGSSQFNLMYRAFFFFDVSAISSDDSINSATMGFVASAGIANGFTSTVELVNATLATNTAVVNADFQGTVSDVTRQATGIAFSAVTADSATYNDFTLNSTGLATITAAVAADGIVKLGFKDNWDVDNAGPTAGASKNSYMAVQTADAADANDRPRLVVTHSPPSAAVTGTIGGGATEQQVRDGGGTIILTLTGVTWNAAGTAFDNARQAIIDGLDSAGSATYGWNAEVRDKLGVSSVVRTSDTIATITVAASDVGDYRIDASETITATVPASAYSGSGALTATPTFTITAAAEGLAVSGTLGGSGGTPAEIRAGGETIILTLTGTEWVSAGASFNAQRQTILNNLVASSSDENGWNARRAAGDFAVGDVERTGATVVTVTLSASTAYSVPATETITATAPAAAIVYGADIVGTPSFALTPTFVATGTRISGAIDLSSISDVAYCAMGWQATTPANTAVTAATSVDGGVTYSSATNGSCPTGIEVGGNLSAITDVRIKLTLTTSDNTVTPLVEGLGLLVQDTSGPALYYQLNTIPGVTITDRSANSNTGTMSFPTSQTGINSTTGVLESTRSSLSLEQLLSVGDIVSPVTGAAVSDNIFNQTETGFGSLPFQDLMQTMATGGELPLKFIWVVAIGLFSIALGVVALHMTGSLMISGIGLGAGLSIGAAIGGGLIPGWTIILFVILALALVVMRSRGALPL